ncbi:MAG: hypothetical protein H7Z75_03500 [Ferruginibacter sp.]|nr:hypothetical protein [Cytophagales bacterium]
MTEDVLYLKNGWVLRGKITSTASDSLVRLRTGDRNQFAFRRAEIDAIEQERAPDEKNIRYRGRGFGHYTELGALATRNTSGFTNPSAFSFQTVNGFKFNQFLYAGLGVGIDLFDNQSLLPLFGSLRGDLTRRGSVLPYYFADLGYGANITGRDEMNFPARTYSGGALFAAGLGIKAIFNRNTGFLLSVGYRSQKTSFRTDNQFGSTDTKANFQRLALRAGFAF